jgi:uncharacterized protein with HEPN domain
MYDKTVLSKLHTCLEHIEAVKKYFKAAQNPLQFFELNEGANYDAVIMRLQAVGENLKRISQKHPFVIQDLKYSEIDNVIRFRDYVSHHYEQLEQEVVFDICAAKMPELSACIAELISKHENL